MMHDHSQKFILVHFHNLSRRQCLRNQDHRFVPKINTDGCTTQYLDQTVGNLLHIIDSSSNDRLFQMSECLNQFISVDHNCISSIYLFIGNAAFNCILVTFGFQKFNLAKKNTGLLFIQKPVGFIQLMKFLNRLKPGFLKITNFFFDVADQTLTYLVFPSAVIQYLADGYS